MSESVSASVKWLELPTYVPGPDSPYPAIGWAGWRNHYPYSTQLDLSTASRPVRHRAVVLENRYVRVVVLPDLGGRVFSLYDKTAGHDAFMVPPSIKYQNVSYRGAWLAGGIELNFGSVHHTVHTVNPVSWAIRRDADGGASVWVGSITRPVEARYAARIRLRPERAAMDLEIHTHGPLTTPGMMYWWSNAGVEVTRDSRFFYYGKYAESGQGKHSWPTCDGLDFSWYRNRLTSGDMFLMESQRDYMAFYDYGRHHGVANAANRFLSPGQKYFTWGNDQRGRYWDLMLSDAEQTYCEIQRGRLPSQGITEPIPPTSDDTWTETWMPLPGTEGFSAMENDLVLSVVAEGSSAVLRLLAAVPMTELRVQAFDGEKPLGAFDVAGLEPGKVFTQRQTVKAGQKCNRVKVTDRAARVLLNWQEFTFEDTDWFNTAHHQWDEDHAGVEELFLEAERRRTTHWPHVANWGGDLYEKVLKQDPGHSGALQARAEMALYAGQFEQAIEHARQALKRRPRDPQLLALLGWGLFRAERADEAIEPFAQAARYEPGRKPGLVGLANAHLKAGRWTDALAAIEELLGERPRDLWGRLLKAIALRKRGRKGEAVALVKALLDEDPLWSRVHAEALLLGVDAALADGTRTLGDDTLTAAVPYLELGLWDDARTLLTVDESNERFSPAIRLAHLAYALHRLNDRAGARAALKDLASAPLAQANCWSTGSLAVLGEMVAAYPDAPMLHAMYGNILSSRRRIDEAGEHWRKALELGLQDTVLDRNLAVYARHKEQKDKELEHYDKAWKLSGGDLNCFAEYDRALATRGLHAQRLALYEALPADRKSRSMARMRHVVQLLDASRYDEGLEELSGGEFLSGEFERTIYVNFTEALLGKATALLAAGECSQAAAVMGRALTYPRNLNVGRSGVWPEEALANYMLGLIAEAAGDESAARRHWMEAATEGHSPGEYNHAYEMLAWLALGKRHKALRLAHDTEKLVRKEEPLGPRFHWWYSVEVLKLEYGFGQMVKGRIDEGRGIWQKALDEQPDARWFRVHLDIPPAVLERMVRKVTEPMALPKPAPGSGRKSAAEPARRAAPPVPTGKPRRIRKGAKR